MKKLFIAFVFAVCAIGTAFADGAYISNIWADSGGLTVSSKGNISIKAKGVITIGDTTSGSTLNANAVYYVGTSATATGGGLVMKGKLMFGSSSAKAAGLNVTITAEAQFTGTDTYFVIATQRGTAAATAPVVVKKVSGSVFTLYADDSSTVDWMAWGY